LVWFRTESKWTRKRTYVQILRSVCCLGVRLFFDDWAGSHNGPAPDHFLRTIGCFRQPIITPTLLCTTSVTIRSVHRMRPVASDHGVM